MYLENKYTIRLVFYSFLSIQVNKMLNSNQRYSRPFFLKPILLSVIITGLFYPQVGLSDSKLNLTTQEDDKVDFSPDNFPKNATGKGSLERNKEPIDTKLETTTIDTKFKIIEESIHTNDENKDPNALEKMGNGLKEVGKFAKFMFGGMGAAAKGMGSPENKKKITEVGGEAFAETIKEFPKALKNTAKGLPEAFKNTAKGLKDGVLQLPENLTDKYAIKAYKISFYYNAKAISTISPVGKDSFDTALKKILFNDEEIKEIEQIDNLVEKAHYIPDRILNIINMTDGISITTASMANNRDWAKMYDNLAEFINKTNKELTGSDEVILPNVATTLSGFEKDKLDIYDIDEKTSSNYDFDTGQPTKGNDIGIKETIKDNNSEKDNQEITIGTIKNQKLPEKNDDEKQGIDIADNIPEKDKPENTVDNTQHHDAGPSSGEYSHDIAELKRALFDLTRTNKVLLGEYKEMKLDLEKAKWNDLYHASVSSQSISSKISKLNNIVSEINRYRGILDGNNNLSDSEKAATIPLTAHDRLVNDYVEKNIASYRAENEKAVAEKIAGIEKSLANTKATANYHSLEYSKLLKDIEKVRKELKAAGFKPTEDNKAIVADSKKKINQWKAEAEKNRVQANIYIRKKLMEEKQLDYAKIDKYHYDGKKNTYQNAKSGLDQAYVGVKPNLIAKETLDTSYNELMAILGQPIVPTKPEPVETPKSEIRMTVLTDHKGLRTTTYHQFNKKDGQFYKSGSGDYQHLSWGTWKGNDSNDYETMHFGHYVEGQATVDLPTSGTASYKGSLSGDFRSRSTNTWEKDVFSGDVQLTANFNKRNIAIDLDLYKDGQSFEKINGTTDILAHDFLAPDSGNVFAYGNKVGEIKRVVSGMFYGPNAEEAGGTWGVFGHPSGKAFGSFRAKQTALNNDSAHNEKPVHWQGFYTSARKENIGGRIHYSSEATDVATHDPIINGKVDIENQN